MPIKSIGLLVLIMAFLTGCASTPQASSDRDREAKQFRTHPNAASVYVYRSALDRLEDLAVLYVDGRIVGETLPGTYFRVDLPPGKHVLHGIASDIGRLTVDVRPGELYFVQLHVVGSQSQYRLVPERTGRDELRDCCVLLESWSPGQRPLLR